MRKRPRQSRKKKSRKMLKRKQKAAPGEDDQVNARKLTYLMSLISRYTIIISFSIIITPNTVFIFLILKVEKSTACLYCVPPQELLKRQRINEEGDSVATASGEADNKEEVTKLLQPCLITGAVLRDYQLYGVNWITSLYENGMKDI